MPATHKMHPQFQFGNRQLGGGKKSQILTWFFFLLCGSETTDTSFFRQGLENLSLLKPIIASNYRSASLRKNLQANEEERRDCPADESLSGGVFRRFPDLRRSSIFLYEKAGIISFPISQEPLQRIRILPG
jgi:hypothetical protein